MTAWREETAPPAGGPLQAIQIECVAPTVDAGRYAAKRVVGEEVEFAADAFKDGHDLLAARLLCCPPGEGSWRAAPMGYVFDDDRWYARVVVDRVGTWRFTVEAWVDEFGTWRAELEKKVAAGQDVASELLEGAEMVHRAVPHARGEEFQRLAAAAAILGDPGMAREERVHAALSAELLQLMEQHGRRPGLSRAEREYVLRVDPPQAAFAAWYEFFPRSTSPTIGQHGTFRDAAGFLQRVAAMGFDTVYLPPIHPIGHAHRKGRNNALVAEPGDVGSPWAIGNEDGGHDAVNPALGTIEDFDAFVAEATRLGIMVALDYALQCSPDHPWVREHPEWFFVRPDGTIKYAENPPKKYEDIYPLNFWCDDRQGLWDACRDVLLFWIAHGVRVFRVDNPHTKPFAFWEWIIAEVHRRHPDVVFLAEAFTRPKRMKNLAKLGFTQSYTYFTWRNTVPELVSYVAELTATPVAEYMRGNLFANTPDILHEFLQKGGLPAFRIRHLLAATLLPVYGIYSGFELGENVPLREGSEEYLDSEKYEVRQRDWDAPGNLAAEIAAVNRIRRENPALQLYRNIRFHPGGDERVICYTKLRWGNDLLIAVSTDPHAVIEADLPVPRAALGFPPAAPVMVEELLGGEQATWNGPTQPVRFDPAGRVGYVWRIVREATPEGLAPAQPARAAADATIEREDLE
ncbi:MAG TPA: alpha-1,4-glucan--maltose-1-phosphate maltosyltransferase [Longimicrobiales bacterium]|nr:alpha-1,4-glucan--maltose-1-phosphate maltosyltransferase [Longimicrobiales bacterium]